MKIASAVSGILGFVLFLLTPLMPVNQLQSSLHWPQGSLNSVTAPLESYAPERIDIQVPVSAIDSLREDESLLVGTLPLDSEQATNRGLFVRSFDGALDVIVRDTVYFQLDAEEVAQLDPESLLLISSTRTETSVSLAGEVQVTSEEEEDKRPQITGIYTELEGDEQALVNAGLNVDVEINSRYTSSPTLLKWFTMIGGTLLLFVSLFCLYRMDGPPTARLLPKGVFRPRLVDGVVGAVLLIWYIFGANTSDDGFILTMARVALDSDYMANYYRWFGVPESPFGAPYYDFLSLMATVSTSSMWMRLPSLISGIVIWLLVSRGVLPRLGDGINARKAAHWTAALMFLAFWLPYNNGLRPEPIIAMGTILSWVCFERAIDQKRLFPAAVGTSIAAFTLACGPTGLMAFSALLVSLSSLFRIMAQRAKTKLEWAAVLAPFLAAGTAVFLAVFGDQTLMTVLESIHVRSDKGPSLKWYQEWVRYEVLFQQTVDGSFSRRIAVLFAFVSVVLVFASMLRNRKVPGSNKGPALRLLMIFMGTLFFMSFTPTKWTHHFGVWAGIAAALGGLAAIALSEFATRSRHSRTLVIGGLLFVFAFSLSGTNGFWYVSSYGIPWWDKSVQFHSVEFATVLMIIALVILTVGVVQSFRSGLATEINGGDSSYKAKDQRPSRFSRLFSAPIAAFCALAVLFSMVSFAKAFVDQYPAYSVGLGNLRNIAGKTCGLADYVLMETNTNDSFLTPVEGTLGDSLETDSLRGFKPNGIPSLGTDQLPYLVSSAELLNVDNGRRDTKGINGSQMILPFNLDPMKVPVLGSYSVGKQVYSEATSQWYEVPKSTEASPLIVVSAAGIIEGVDADGVKQEGRKLVLQYGKKDESGKIEELGETQMLDIGPQQRWRNLRLPIEDLPEEANVIRIHAVDSNLDPKEWLVFTPPRVPNLDTLNNVIGSETPGLLDWSVPLQFSCQRPFNHYAGVAEIPQYRILPDYKGKRSGTSFEDYHGGGVLGTAEAVNYSYEVPAYAKDDWLRDWGAIEKYEMRPNSVGEVPDLAAIELETITRSGLWNPGHQNIDTDKKEYD